MEEEGRKKNLVIGLLIWWHGRATPGTGRAKLLVFVCFGQVIRHDRALISTARANASGH